MSLGRTYFSLTPLNNIVEYSPSSGQNIISVQCPDLNRILDEFNMTGYVRVDTAPDTHYAPADVSNVVANSKEPTLDNVMPIESLIDRVEIRSLQGNTQLEQQLDAPLVSKVLDKAPWYSNNDLNVGSHACTDIGAEFAAGTMRRLTRASDGADGTPFCTTLKARLLAMKRNIPLDKIAGLRIDIYLKTFDQAFFNLDNEITNKIDANFQYSVHSVEFFGRYMMAPAVSKATNALGLKMVNPFLQMVQSSNETFQYSPMLNNLDRMILVTRPNSFKTNSQQCETRIMETPEQSSTKFSKSGQLFPYDFKFKNTPSVADLDTAVMSVLDLKAGSAESCYHACIGLNGSYPPYHSLMTQKNEAQANSDLYYLDASAAANESQNYNVNNLMPTACVNYQYGFKQFPGSQFQRSTIGVQIESSVNGAASSVMPTALRNQAQAATNLLVYNAAIALPSLVITK